MPRIYRVMKRDGERPAVGERFGMLGVRVPADIRPDEDGNVHPGTGGMSVAPSLAAILPHLLPKRLEHLVPGAKGKNSHRVWRLGEGPFAAAPVAARIELRPDPDKPAEHGLVEPTEAMPLSDYRSALAATQDQWVIDEENDLE